MNKMYLYHRPRILLQFNDSF